MIKKVALVNFEEITEIYLDTFVKTIYKTKILNQKQKEQICVELDIAFDTSNQLFKAYVYET